MYPKGLFKTFTEGNTVGIFTASIHLNLDLLDKNITCVVKITCSAEKLLSKFRGVHRGAVVKV